MKKITVFALSALMCANALTAAESDIITLDLTKAATELKFDAETGAWTETYSEEATAINSQCFSFVKGAITDWQTWWGFTASNSADNARQENTLKYQFSNMAAGGIVLGEDGSVKLDDFGAPVVSAEVPYLVAFYSPFSSERSIDLTFADGKSYEPQCVYVNLNSYPYYCIEYGDAYARAFNNGDKFTITFHGVAAGGREKTVEVSLASYANGNLTINRGWMYVDLKDLGVVNEIYCTMESTDTGDYGMNTPGYFCMDKLAVKAAAAGVETLASDKTIGIKYDYASKLVTLTGADFATVTNAAGQKLMAVEATQFSIAHLPAGVYLVKVGDKCIKIAR